MHPSIGKRVDILIPIEEGERYRLGGITFTGNKAVTNTRVLRAQFAHQGRRLLQRAPSSAKASSSSARPTASSATSTSSARPRPRFDEAKHLVYLDIDIEEGKHFYVSRIEFTGNTITRDKVIRRELLLEEGSGLQLAASSTSRCCA